MQVFSLQNPVTGDMVDHPNTIFIAAVGTYYVVYLLINDDPSIMQISTTGDGFPFTKSLSGFDWIIQFLNFGGLINSKGPFQRRIFGGSVGEKHPLVQLYLDKVYGPQVFGLFLGLTMLGLLVIAASKHAACSWRPLPHVIFRALNDHTPNVARTVGQEWLLCRRREILSCCD